MKDWRQQRHRRQCATAFAAGFAAAALLSLPASADILRPFDERATIRLIVAEVARQAPDAEISVPKGTRNAAIGVMYRGAGRGLFVDEIHAALRSADDGTEREAILQAFVRDTLAMQSQRAAAQSSVVTLDLTQIMPVLRTQEQIAFSNGGSDTFRLPAIGGLIQCWVIHVPKQPRGCLPAWQARSLGFGKLEITKLGLENLDAQRGEIVETVEGRLRHVTLGARFAASLMLSTDYWQSSGTGRVIAAIPTDRDLFWIEDPNDAELLQLRTRVEDLHSLAARGEIPPRQEIDLAYGLSLGVQPLSTDLFLRTGSGWEILPE